MEFWGEATLTAIFILKRLLKKSLDGITPYEGWHGTKPSIHFLRVFGSIAYAKEMWPGIKKLDDRSHPMMMLGYEPGSKACRLYDLVKKHIHVSHDVIFDEGEGWKWGSSTADRRICQSIAG